MRTLVLFVVVLMAFIVAAPTLRSYVRQQEEHRELAGQIETVKEHNARLQQQVKQWEDPTYVQAQARDRLGFVMPGETPYRVVDPQVVTGEKVDDRSRDEKAPVVVGSQAPWYVSVWDSIQMAGEVDQ